MSLALCICVCLCVCKRAFIHPVIHFSLFMYHCLLCAGTWLGTGDTKIKDKGPCPPEAPSLVKEKKKQTNDHHTYMCCKTDKGRVLRGLRGRPSKSGGGENRAGERERGWRQEKLP